MRTTSSLPAGACCVVADGCVVGNGFDCCPALDWADEVEKEHCNSNAIASKDALFIPALLHCRSTRDP